MDDTSKVSRSIDSANSFVQTLAENPELISKIDFWVIIICMTFIVFSSREVINMIFKKVSSKKDLGDLEVSIKEMILHIMELKRASQRVVGLCINMDKSISKLDGVVDTLVKIFKNK